MPHFGQKFKFNSKIHWNGSVCCAIAIETTGPEPGFHDLVNFALLPLDSQFEVSKEISLVDIMIQEKRPENTPEKFNRQRLARIKTHGIDPYRSAEHFIEWFDKLGLPLNKKILPLSFQWSKVQPFLIDWLGFLNYNHIFSTKIRDISTACHYENDIDDARVEQIRFPKDTLTYICNCLNVNRIRPHEAIQDTYAITQCYQRMVLTH